MGTNSGSSRKVDGFFPDEEVKSKDSDRPWKKKARDWVLDTYFAAKSGSSPKQMALKVGRSHKAVKRLIEQFTNNELDRVLRYEPFKRKSRQGLRFTQNEMQVIRGNRDKHVPAKDTARLLCREVEEITKEFSSELAEAKKLTTVAPTLDIIWAHRYIHFVYKTPILTDKAYDALVDEEIEYGGGGPAFQEIKDFRGWPKHIISLALYLVEKHKSKK